ncbi:MAG: hypothetical protein IKU78_05090 [Paludibacteraceae bacterium]|nr:hypothetical protein [Paludibacteraceae bacterium]
MNKQTIVTFPRFLYLNTYAFLLLVGGIGIVLFPFYQIYKWLFVPQIIIALICLKNSWRIFHSWNDKKRKYNILIQRNSDNFRPDTFYEYMQAPCGRLLVKIVLKDLNISSKYSNLKKMKQPFFTVLKNSCKTQKTVIYTNSNKN